MVGDPHYSQSQAVTIARQFDVIAARDGVFTPYVSAMKAAHPSLLIVGESVGVFDVSSGGNAYPASWYEHDSRGNRIRSNGYGFYLMDPTNPSVAASDGQSCSAVLADSKYDGCFLDTMGEAPLIPGYCTGLPINRSTGRVFTLAEWINGTSSVAKAVKAANSKHVVIPNGLANGDRYFLASGPSRPLLTASGLAMAEIWLRSPTVSAGQYPSVTQWQQDVDMLVNAESQGWGVMTTTKLWTGASAAEQLAWHKFTLASFLLGAGGHSAYSFSTASTAAALSATSSVDTQAIGSPMGPYTVHLGVYQRSFTGGVIVVNPGATAVTLTFPSSYTNLDGSLVRSETLQPHSGDVLIHG